MKCNLKLPKVPKNFVESSVTLALVAASSSVSESSDAEKSPDNAAKVLSSPSVNDLNKQDQICTEHIHKQNISERTTASSDVILRQVTDTENINSSETPMDNTSRLVELNELHVRMDVGSDDNSRKLCDETSENKPIDIKDPAEQ